VVLTTDDQEGWVFRPFIETQVAIASLPVSEAYGGPNGSTSPNAPLNLVVTIWDNKATVALNGFPKKCGCFSKVGQWQSERQFRGSQRQHRQPRSG
jgi:hypothetical protein